MVAVPMPAANDLLDRLDALMQVGRNDLELKRIELEALNLVRKGGDLIAPYSCVLGAVYSHKFEWDKAEINFNKAIAYAHDDNIVIYRMNKGKGLHQTYQNSKAAELAFELYRANEGNLVVLDEAIAMSRKALRFDWLEVLMKSKERLDPSCDLDLVRDEKSFVERLKKNGISFDDLSSALDIATTVLAEERLPRRGGRVFINSDGAALYTLLADVSPQEASRLTFEMADRVTEKCNVVLLDSVVFNVTPYEPPVVPQ